MLQSSLTYAGGGAVAGVLVLLVGLPVLLFAYQREQQREKPIKYVERRFEA
jgi:hypothetical protein